MPLDDAVNQQLEQLYQSQNDTQNISKENQQLEEIYRSKNTQDGPKGFGETVTNWFTGTKSTEFPDMPAFQPGNVLSEAYKGGEFSPIGRGAIMLGSMLTSDQEIMADIIRNWGDGVRIVQDKFKNPIVVMKDGRTFYLNKPGADLQDVTELTSQLFQMGLGGPLTAPIRNFGARVVAQGLFQSGLSQAQDIATMPLGGEGVNFGKATVAGLAGAGGELILGPAFNAFANKFGKNSKFFKVDLDGNPTITKEGAEALKAAGYDPDIVINDKTALNALFNNITQPGVEGGKAYQNFVQAYQKWIKDNPSAQTEAQYGFKLTKDQAARNAPGVATLYKAAQSDVYGPEVRAAAVDFLESQGINIKDTAFDLLNRFNKGQIDFKDLEGSGSQVINTIRNLFKKKSDEVTTAYNIINTDGVYTGPRSNLDVLSLSLDKSLEDKIVNPGVTPVTVWLRGELQKFIDGIKSGTTKWGTDGKIGYVSEANIKKFEDMRKIINDAYNGISPNSSGAKFEYRNIMALKKEYDKFLNDATENALFSGAADNPKLAAAIKSARKQAQEKAELFEVNPIRKRGLTINDPGGELIQKILYEKDITPMNVINNIFGKNSIGENQEALQVVKRLKKVFGVTDAESAAKNGDFQALKQSVVQKIALKAMNAETGQFEPKVLVREWSKLFKNNKDLVKELFNEKEIKFISGFVNEVRKTLKPANLNLAKPLGLIDGLVVAVGNTLAGGAGYQASGSLYGGLAARNFWTRIVDMFHTSEAKKMVYKQLKQSPSMFDDAGKPVLPGKFVADALEKLNVPVSPELEKSMTIGALGGLYGKEKYGNRDIGAPRISAPNAQRGIQKTQPRVDVPVLNRNMMTASTTPTAGGLTNIPQEQLDKYSALFGKIV